MTAYIVETTKDSHALMAKAQEALFSSVSFSPYFINFCMKYDTISNYHKLILDSNKNTAHGRAIPMEGILESARRIYVNSTNTIPPNNYSIGKDC